MRTAHRSQRGYTAVEILTAMTLFAIGAAGVIGMQRVTIQGGQDARRLDIATNIAHEWAARLQRDATTWTLPSNTNRTTTDVFTNTTWLRNVAVGSCNPPNYCDPPAVTSGQEAGMSGAFDAFGRDRPVDSNDHVYCVQYRLAWTRPIGTPPALNEQAAVSATIRVYFSRLERAPIGTCANPNPSPNAPNANEFYHFVYVPTLLRSTQAPQ